MTSPHCHPIAIPLPSHIHSPCIIFANPHPPTPRINGYPRRQPGVATTLVGMTTPDMVTQNVDAVLAALGIKKPAAADGEAAAANGEAAAADAAADAVVAELEQLFVARGVKDVTWPSGRPLPAGY